MGNFTIAFFTALGFSVWVYSKLMRSTGGNTKSSLTATAIIGVLTFIVMLVILGILIPGGGSGAPAGEA
jgi:hypothetical protein